MFKIVTIIFLFLLLPLPVFSSVLTEDTVWQGRVELREDVLVPPGVTLTVLAGTEILIWPAENTKIDPEYMSHQTEILVRGVLKVNGNSTAPVSFKLGGAEEGSRWSGIIVDGGQVVLDHFSIRSAESGVTVINGSLSAENGLFADNRYGIVGQGDSSSVTLKNCHLRKNDYGLLSLDNAVIDEQLTVFEENGKKDFFKGLPGMTVVSSRPVKVNEEKNITKIYKDEALVGYTVWQGRVVIDGQLRLPPDGRLIILPGTIIEFTKKDTNNDGIGENGLQVQGIIIAKGTPDEPIIFRSAEKEKNRGDWDAINVLGSDLAQNLFEFCLIENAYRGLHFHFSNVAVNHAVLRNNYRGAQFQESLVSFRNSQLYDNKSAVQARDSEVIFDNNEIFNNINGANFFRLNLEARDNSFVNNYWDGLRIREGASRVNRNRMSGNRTGLLIADAVYGNFSKNVLNANSEVGIMVRDTDHVEISGNAVTANGINGISLRESRAVIASNLLAYNGERGIGVESFSGTINNNNIVGNGLYGIGLDGKSDVEATGNWWADSDLAREIYDRHDEPELGEVSYEPQLKKPVLFNWPLAKLLNDTTWAGEILVKENILVPKNITLKIEAGTTVFFDNKEAGLNILGNLRATGRPEKRIRFTSVKQSGPGDWGEVYMEQVAQSVIKYCDIEYATWGIHCHFAPIAITGCRFSHNDGGIRFRSGPMLISRTLFSRNRLGIRAFRGDAEIFDNEFDRNEISIFVREGGQGVKIHHNNFLNNDRYALRLGDFNAEDVDATNNWWGGISPLELIFDGHNEPEIGMVNFEPVLSEAIKLGLGVEP
ncbi:MAG: right-handed parallel beta-helix repeat-containing protein [Proteobacteria bacterium]|nr:right-handed parallel beta-helix repeat-containing protein [Pseudomonadota bacterium]MBU1716499.1 right-handed parallel beta-helix repeat-containing protein [Pseudomonadota bacterium]